MDFRRVFSRVRRVVYIALLILAASWCATYYKLNASVDRYALGLEDEWDKKLDCPVAIPQFQSVSSMIPANPTTGEAAHSDGKSFRSQLTASRHAIYAIAAVGAYGRQTIDPNFTITAFDGVQSLSADPPKEWPGGLRMDTYILSKNPPTVLVAFRGTRSLANWEDMLSNLYWFTGWLPQKTAYDSARDAFMAVRRATKEQFPDQTISYIATGHSLGGGLAQHIAFGFPCVSAVVFDTSPVSGRFVYKVPFDSARIISIRQKGEILTTLTFAVRGMPRDSDVSRDQPLDVVTKIKDCQNSGRLQCPNNQHSMLELAAGMARYTGECIKSKLADCGRDILSDADSAKLYHQEAEIYCKSYGDGDSGVCPVPSLEQPSSPN